MEQLIVWSYLKQPKTNAEKNEDTDVVNTVFEPLKLL